MKAKASLSFGLEGVFSFRIFLYKGKGVFHDCFMRGAFSFKTKMKEGQ